MAEILSLSKARKAKARATKEQVAAENRAKFGRTRAGKQRDATIKAKDAAHLDGAKRSDD
jgi:hypothetical protein